MLEVISLGAGVQSTVMALMAAKGELSPMPDCAIFADTKFEPKGVYTHLDWLEKQLPFPTYRVTVVIYGLIIFQAEIQRGNVSRLCLCSPLKAVWDGGNAPLNTK